MENKTKLLQLPHITITKFWLTILMFLLYINPINATAYQGEYNESHWYIGARTGASDYKDSCDSDASMCDDTAFSYGLYGGFKFTPWFALEGAITDYGKIEASYDDGNTEVDIFGSELTGVFSYNIINSWDVYARAGLAYQNIEKQSFWEKDQTANEFGLVSALGIEYRIAEQWSVRTEYQFIDGIGNSDVSKSDLYFVSLGLSYHFNQKELPIVRPAPITAPVVMKKIILTESTLGEDMLFTFDSSEIKINNQLDNLLAELKLHDGAIVITGHTDSIGTPEYNQKLSQKRANSIAHFLIYRGINKERITVRAMGESKPLATNMYKKGRAKNRRVEIDYKVKVNVVDNNDLLSN